MYVVKLPFLYSKLRVNIRTRSKTFGNHCSTHFYNSWLSLQFSTYSHALYCGSNVVAGSRFIAGGWVDVVTIERTNTMY